MLIRQLIREPLIHFLFLGGVLFVVYGIVNRDGLLAAEQILVDQNRVNDLINQYRRVWQRPPTAGELQGLIDNWLREEVFYREGLMEGLDRNDPMIRRRVA